MILRCIKLLAVAVMLLFVLTISGCIEEVDVETKPPAPRFADTFNPNDNWLIYWYVCGSDLESGGGAATSDINEMLQAQLPANVKILIQAGGTTEWKNPVIKSGATN